MSRRCSWPCQNGSWYLLPSWRYRFYRCRRAWRQYGNHWRRSWVVTIDRHRVRYRLGARSPGIPDRNLCSSGRFSASARFCPVAGICWSGIRPDSWNLRCSRLPCRLRKHIGPIWLRRCVDICHVRPNRQEPQSRAGKHLPGLLPATAEVVGYVVWTHIRDSCRWQYRVPVPPSFPER